MDNLSDRRGLVDIIVPIRNASSFLDSFFGSLEKQTTQNFNVFVSYGTSDDGTLNWLNEYKKIAKFNLIIEDLKDMGVGEAKNYWLDSDKLKAPYIVIIDVDDYLEPTFIEKLLNAEESTKADLVQCGFRRFNADNGKTISFDMVHNKEELTGDIFKDPGLVYTHTATWNKLYKKELIGSDIRFGNGRKFEDLVFVLEYLSRCHTIKYVNEPLYNYRISKLSRSSMNDVDEVNSSNHDVQEELKSLKEFYLKNNKEAIDNGFLSAIVFMRYGIGFTTRMALSGHAKWGRCAKDSKRFLDDNFPLWRTTPFFKGKNARKFSKKTIFVRWCRHLYKMNMFPLFVLCYSLFTSITGKDIKP